MESGLRDLEPLPTELASDRTDIAKEFYRPCLRRSSNYLRITGYFSSLVYLVAWSALRRFVVENGGRMKIICSPQLSPEDAKGIEFGYNARDDKELVEKLRSELKAMLENDELRKPTRLLAALISDEIVEVRLAEVSQSAPLSVKRMFHDKVGIFEDESGHCVGFRGSLNETFLGLSSELGHVESIDVFPSWDDGRDRKRAENSRARFKDIWAGNAERRGIRLSPLPPEIKADLTNIQEVDFERALEQMKQGERQATPESRSQSQISLRRHQEEALEEWQEAGFKGILAHATGSGKTVTGIFAIRKLLDRNVSTVIVVPKEEIQSQWYEEIRSIVNLRSIRCGGGHSSWKAERLVRAAVRADDPEVIIAVLASARHPAFLRQLEAGIGDTFLIVDEVHRVGSPDSRRIMEKLDPPYRLGLSATPQRSGDPVGTEKIMEFFGGIVHSYTLSNAIEDGYLAHYSYDIDTVHLDEDEQDEWDKRTKRIGQLRARQESSSNDKDLEEKLRKALIQRAKIKKGAAAKAPKAVDIIEREYEAGDRWLIYCDDQDQVAQLRQGTDDLGIPVREFHSKMAGARERTLEWLKGRGGVVVSMKCLDEGVDIPTANKGLILASSTNPRQFIQRRGRLLRKGRGSTIARLYDLIILPANTSSPERTRSLLAPELARALMFARDSVSRHSESELEKIWMDHNLPAEELEDLASDGVELDGEIIE